MSFCAPHRVLILDFLYVQLVAQLNGIAYKVVIFLQAFNNLYSRRQQNNLNGCYGRLLMNGISTSVMS